MVVSLYAVKTPGLMEMSRSLQLTGHYNINNLIDQECRRLEENTYWAFGIVTSDEVFNNVRPAQGRRDVEMMIFRGVECRIKFLTVVNSVSNLGKLHNNLFQNYFNAYAPNLESVGRKK